MVTKFIDSINGCVLDSHLKGHSPDTVCSQYCSGGAGAESLCVFESLLSLFLSWTEQ